jgi:hypothetical protein
MNSPARRREATPELMVYSRVDDEQFVELSGLCAQRIVHATVWEETLLAALDHDVAEAWVQDTFDIDLYLGDGVYLELFGVCCFPAPDAEPWQGHEVVGERLGHLIAGGVWLDEVAVNEDDSLILILARRRQPGLYLAVSAWSLHEWEELPTDEDARVD